MHCIVHDLVIWAQCKENDPRAPRWDDTQCSPAPATGGKLGLSNMDEKKSWGWSLFQAKVEEAPGIIPIGGDADTSAERNLLHTIGFTYVIPQWRDALSRASVPASAAPDTSFMRGVASAAKRSRGSSNVYAVSTCFIA